MKLWLGDMVQIRRIGEADSQHNILYAGWRGRIMRVSMPTTRFSFLVNSDEWSRHTGKLQGVSFRAWFYADELDLICASCGNPENDLLELRRDVEGVVFCDECYDP